MGGSLVPDADDGFAAGAIARAALDVADGLDVERFAVWGASAGSAPAIVIAAEQPDRVDALILIVARSPHHWTHDREFQFEFAAVVRGLGGRELIRKVYADEGLVLPPWAAALDPDGEAIARTPEGTIDYPWASGPCRRCCGRRRS